MRLSGELKTDSKRRKKREVGHQREQFNTTLLQRIKLNQKMDAKANSRMQAEEACLVRLNEMFRAELKA